MYDPIIEIKRGSIALAVCSRHAKYGAVMSSNLQDNFFVPYDVDKLYNYLCPLWCG